MMSDSKTKFENPNESINSITVFYKIQMSDQVFEKLSTFIYNEYGIKMQPVKKVMLQSRLQKRLRDLNIDSFEKYVDFVFSKEGEARELVHMIDVITTNKTDFFREPAHFDFLNTTVLPEFVEKNKKHPNNNLKIWSAGCSSGEEVYTLAIVLTEFFAKNKKFDFSIFGTDISFRILQKAIDAIYAEDRIANIPVELKRKYFLKSKNRDKPTVRVTPDLRKKASYNRLNFMDDSYSVNDTFDIIFCRNVLIYFDRETQQKVINKLCNYLKTGGYFFLGHSESISGMDVPLVQLKPTVFMKV